MGDINFNCVICEAEFKVDGHCDQNKNKCPNCGQTYNYDEGLTIELTEEKIKWLAAMSGV